MDTIERLTQDLKQASELVRTLQNTLQENTLSQAKFKSELGVRLENVMEQIKILQETVYGEGLNPGLSKSVARLVDYCDSLREEVGGKIGPMEGRLNELAKDLNDLKLSFERHLESLVLSEKEAAKQKREDDRFSRGQRNALILVFIAAWVPGMVAFFAWVWRTLSK